MKSDLQRTDEVFVLYVKLFPSHRATILYQMSTRLGFNVGDLYREHVILRGGPSSAKTLSELSSISAQLGCLLPTEQREGVWALNWVSHFYYTALRAVLQKGQKGYYSYIQIAGVSSWDYGERVHRMGNEMNS